MHQLKIVSLGRHETKIKASAELGSVSDRSGVEPTSKLIYAVGRIRFLAAVRLRPLCPGWRLEATSIPSRNPSHSGSKNGIWSPSPSSELSNFPFCNSQKKGALLLRAHVIRLGSSR